jgi:hypothetical protein
VDVEQFERGESVDRRPANSDRACRGECDDHGGDGAGECHGTGWESAVGTNKDESRAVFDLKPTRCLGAAYEDLSPRRKGAKNAKAGRDYGDAIRPDKLRVPGASCAWLMAPVI